MVWTHAVTTHNCIDRRAINKRLSHNPRFYLFGPVAALTAISANFRENRERCFNPYRSVAPIDKGQPVAGTIWRARERRRASNLRFGCVVNLLRACAVNDVDKGQRSVGVNLEKNPGGPPSRDVDERGTI